MDSTNPSVKKTLNLSRTPSRPLTNMKSLGLYQRKKRKNSSRLNEHKLPHVVLSVKLAEVDEILARVEVLTAEGEEVEGEVEGAAAEGASQAVLEEKKTTMARKRKRPLATNVRGLWNQMERLAQASEETMPLLPSRLPRRQKPMTGRQHLLQLHNPSI